MLLRVFYDGILIGVLASIPLGPIGVFVIQRTLYKGRFAGLFSGVGAALSDTLYAIIAGFSLSFIIDFIREMQSILQLFGSLVLLGFGFFLFQSNPVRQLRKQNAGSSNYMQDLAATFLLTISNPMILFVYLGIFAGFNLMESTDSVHVLTLIGGIFTGGCIWWFSISTFVNLFRSKFNPRRLFWVNRISGLIVMALALFSVAYAIAKMLGFNLPNMVG